MKACEVSYVMDAGRSDGQTCQLDAPRAALLASFRLALSRRGSRCAMCQLLFATTTAVLLLLQRRLFNRPTESITTTITVASMPVVLRGLA